MFSDGLLKNSVSSEYYILLQGKAQQWFLWKLKL